MNEELFGLLGGDPDAINQQAKMSGLLNFAANLLQASGPSRTPQSLGANIGAALPGYAQGYQSTIDSTLKNLAMRQKLSEEQRKQDALKQYRERISAATGSVVTPQDRMATQSNIDPMFLEGMSNQQLEAQAPRTQFTDQGAADRATLDYLQQVDPVEYAKLIAREPKAPPASVQEYEYAVQQGFKGTLQDFMLRKAEAGRTVIDMTGGQKGLDNELKIRGAFQSEPAYKGFQEMKTAYGQIKGALKEASPAGDLAAATKFMKLLDPGSVVRESELFMAMQASGLLDRAVNYAQMRINGQKLTPSQRNDFETLSSRLYDQAVLAFNQKQGEYAGIAKSYDLDPSRAVGRPADFVGIRVDNQKQGSSGQRNVTVPY